LVLGATAKLSCQWFPCRPGSSCSAKNKLKDLTPLVTVDCDGSTVELPFSSKRKTANAFGYCLESEGRSHGMRNGANEEEKRTMNIKRTKTDYFIQNKHFDFNGDELEVVDILFNLP
ncbi:hypothetical protein S83_004838, partial [Arachis hypogaea]